MSIPKYPLLAFVTVTPLALFANPKTDQKIEESARGSYTLHRVLNDEIDVKVNDGVAILTGRVRDPDQSRLAEDTVANIEGVKRVDNRIKLDPSAKSATDEWLTVKIRSKLLLERNISLAHTKVDVRDGVVTLTGTADSSEQKRRTEEAVKGIAGVRQVRNLLDVAERTAKTAPPRNLSPAQPNGAGMPTGRSTVSEDGSAIGSLHSGIEDAAITTRIRFQLSSHDETSAAKAKIDTDDGRVVISGEAESEAQRQRVTELARGVRGVTQVENRMTVRKP